MRNVYIRHVKSTLTTVSTYMDRVLCNAYFGAHCTARWNEEVRHYMARSRELVADHMA